MARKNCELLIEFWVRRTRLGGLFEYLALWRTVGWVRAFNFGTTWATAYGSSSHTIGLVRFLSRKNIWHFRGNPSKSLDRCESRNLQLCRFPRKIYQKTIWTVGMGNNPTILKTISSISGDFRKRLKFEEITYWWQVGKIFQSFVRSNINSYFVNQLEFPEIHRITRKSIIIYSVTSLVWN